ncbi:phage tail protein [Cellulomonas xiejunii]|uniref:Phage tail protein n=1 Tax=Cellulomonas xiejunii TaxID=2968083 RepID=A0ABY5KPZ3_9CELL|nr:phage tail protein [Cellulomonas xiejunii]MCC2320961.1 phage tail protein [Cellulomonas xiejunii]UUI71241.1 phage tail protein [Cellulomonas xiejunii]
MGRAEDWLLAQLPAGMVAEDFFSRFVRIFQAEAETLLAHPDNLPYLADPRLAPPEMVRYLARWIGLPGLDADLPEDLQRDLLVAGAAALPWRGTAHGLRVLLEGYTGGPAHVVDGGGVHALGDEPTGTAWVRLEAASTGRLTQDELVELVRAEVPAHVRVELVVAGRTVWPRPEGESR